MTERLQVSTTSLTCHQLSSHVFCLLSLLMINCPCSRLRSRGPIITQQFTPFFWIIPISIPICHCSSYLQNNNKNILSLDLISCAGCCPFLLLFTSKLLENLTYTCSFKLFPFISPTPTSVKFLSPMIPLKLLPQVHQRPPCCSTEWLIPDLLSLVSHISDSPSLPSLWNTFFTWLPGLHTSDFLPASLAFSCFAGFPPF